MALASARGGALFRALATRRGMTRMATAPEPGLVRNSPRAAHQAWRKPELLAALVIGLIFSLILPRLWVGDLLNSYAYMSDDSFDWVTQGVALVEFLSGQDRSTWPILRPPGFVSLLAVDHWLGNHGIVFFAAQIGALAALAFAMARFARVRGAGYFASLLAGVAATISIFGMFAVWILSDAIASSLMAISAASVLNRLRNPVLPGIGSGLIRLSVPVLLAVGAGITQTYGMIPMLVICCAFGGLRLLAGRGLDGWLPPLLAATATGALGFGIQKSWAALIPHGMQPSTFSLLKPSLAMLPFYANVWPLAFGIFVPIMLWAAINYARNRRLPGIEQWSLLAVVAIFALLTLAYQWPDSRLTYMYVPVFLLMVISLSLQSAPSDKHRAAKSSNFALAASFSASILAALTILPGDYWHPSLSAARFAPAQTWLPSALSADPVDRFRLRIVCAGMDDVCARATLPPPVSPYRDKMLREYKRRRTQ